MLVGLEGYLGYELFGWPGLSIAAVLGGYVGWIFTRVMHLRRGVRTMVTNAAELKAEIRTLKRLEGLAQTVRRAGEDRKWT